MFNFRFDKRIIYLILGIFLIKSLIDGGQSNMLALLLTLPGIFIAITFHEFAHAYVAYKLGDQTPKMQGRINLNPLKHIDPIGFVFLIIAGFGWGKPVQIDSRNFNGKYSISKAEAIVSAAGPIANFIMAFVFIIIFHIMQVLIIKGIVPISQTVYIIIAIIESTAFINVALGIFNLIPLPPLDGSKILMHFLPGKSKQWFYNNQTIFYIIFLAIFITGFSRIIVTPIFNVVYNSMDFIVYNIFKLFI